MEREENGGTDKITTQSEFVHRLYAKTSMGV